MLPCTDGALNPPTRPGPGIFAARLMPRCTSAAGLTRSARRRSPPLPSALTVRHHWNAGLAFGMSTGLAACGRHSLECVIIRNEPRALWVYGTRDYGFRSDFP